MRYPYHNRTKNLAITNPDGAIYAYQWASWRLLTTGTIFQRIVRHYLCGRSHEVLYRTEPFEVPASDIEHREAVFSILRRMADLAAFDRHHIRDPLCKAGCSHVPHHEPAALHPREPTRRRRMRQTNFGWAQSA